MDVWRRAASLSVECRISYVERSGRSGFGVRAAASCFLLLVDWSYVMIARVSACVWLECVCLCVCCCIVSVGVQCFVAMRSGVECAGVVIVVVVVWVVLLESVSVCVKLCVCVVVLRGA